jgi:hypothetical protein
MAVMSPFDTRRELEIHFFTPSLMFDVRRSTFEIFFYPSVPCQVGRCLALNTGKSLTTSVIKAC